MERLAQFLRVIPPHKGREAMNIGCGRRYQ